MTTGTSRSNRLGTRLLKMLAGTVIGYLAISAFFWSGLGKSIALLGTGPLVLAGSGMIYLIMAAIVGLGSLFPAAGSKFLNVADRDQLDEDRKTLLESSLTFVLLAALQIAIAASGPGGPVGQVTAIVVVVAAIVGTLGIAIVQWRRTDELMRQVSWESSGIALIVLWVVLGGWATFVVFAAAPPIDPYGVIAALFFSLIAGSFIGAGRRGLLEQG